ncbi:hypothetical protein KGF57_001961 [Candida theae]|uniref:Smr domain-containing protein n=1 Tax=Candida theae TaxID=1198502 RepID=A0AAD5BFW9_9ASCO|nr:uncharacterized protein KGF57_001961 [Candida theae]KAI5960017.1 hypothetical protein KGF57_001961 [Candida theae]
MENLNEKLAKTSLSVEDQDQFEDTRKEIDTPVSLLNGNKTTTTSTTANGSSKTSTTSNSATSRSTNISRKPSTTSSKSSQDGNLTTESEYAQFFTDKSDLDSNFINLVEQLSDIFPHLSKTDLKIRLKLCDDVDQLMEELFIESEQKELLETEGLLRKEDPFGSVESSFSEDALKSRLAWYRKPLKAESKLQSSKYIVEMCQLQDIFPHLSPSLIEQALIQNKGQMDAASINLLDPDSIEIEKSYNSRLNAWQDNDELMTRLKKFLDIDNGASSTDSAKRVLEDDEISFHIHKCNQDYSATLKSIVVNCRPKVRQEVTIRGIGGRVQRGGSKSAPRVKKEYRLTPSSYKYDPSRTESAELQHMYLVNEELQQLAESDLTNALEFYEGDCDRVLQFAIEVLSTRGLEGLPTLESSMKTDAKRISTRGGPITNHEGNVYQDLSKSFQGYSVKSRRSPLQTQHSATTQEISTCVANSRIDLHGKTALEALALTRKVLDAWWREEVDQRIENGKLNSYGNTAVFVNNLLLITGRGIHSVNGVSIIRRYVKEYLVRNRYIFEEGVGNFEVTGLRKR